MYLLFSNLHQNICETFGYLKKKKLAKKTPLLDDWTWTFKQTHRVRPWLLEMRFRCCTSKVEERAAATLDTD